MAAPWKPTPTKNVYDRPAGGNHPAVLVAMIDLGTHKRESQDKTKMLRQRRVFCVWELVTEPDTNYTDGRNFLVTADLNLSNNENAKFRQWAAARLNKKFEKEYEHDFSQEVGKLCLLSVSINAAGWPKVDGMAAVPKFMSSVPPAKLTPFLWSLDNIPQDGTEPQFPDWVPKKLYGRPLTDIIAECEEFNPEDEGRPAGDDGTPGDDLF